MLKGKKILLGISGGIAAYKSVYLVRELKKQGADVKVVMTPAATEFVGKLTLATLSGYPVYERFFDQQTGQWFSHVELGLWADIFVIAPATANTIAKMAHGLADNLLLTIYLSARCPVVVAPAMDVDMYNHPATQQNLEILKQRGNIILEPNEGELASGLVGKGRMQEPGQIVRFLERFFSQSQSLKGKKALVTAGPTYEMIDPVRFIGNFSSGKMGYAIAEELAARGAKVYLISGPTHLTVNHPDIELIKVVSAREMHRKALEIFPLVQIAVLAAAVADYRPAEMATQKIKKTGDELVIRLVKNPDIARDLGQRKSRGQILVGFALETENELHNARHKLESKNFDFIVLNSLRDKGAGFGIDTNKVKFIFRDGQVKDFPLKTKKDVAKDIIDEIEHLLDKQDD